MLFDLVKLNKLKITKYSRSLKKLMLNAYNLLCFDYFILFKFRILYIYLNKKVINFFKEKDLILNKHIIHVYNKFSSGIH